LIDIGATKAAEGNIFHQFNFKSDVLEKMSFVHLEKMIAIQNGELIVNQKRSSLLKN